MSLIRQIRKQLAAAKDENVWMRLLWTEISRLQRERLVEKYSDQQAVEMRYFKSAGRVPDLENPSRLSEKMLWLNLNYQDPLMIRCANKLNVREYLNEIGHGELLNELIAVYETAKEINHTELPSRFVLKCTHGSGWNLIVNGERQVNWLPWRMLFGSWLKYDFYINGRELIYRGAPRRIVCEKYLEDSKGRLTDYKFFCFNGEPRFIQVNLGRNTSQHVQNFYDLEWNLQPFGKDMPPCPDENIQAPENYDQMVEVARDLSAPFPFVRVDLYNVDGIIYFGEFTFFPNAGKPDFVPSEYDAIVGEMLELPSALSGV